MKKFLILPIFLFCGCVAIWGGAHNVVHSDESSITIQYDNMATSSVRAGILARQHCNKYGKEAEPVSAEMPGLLIGIIEEKYICIAPKS